MARPTPILGEKLLLAICEKAGVDPNVTRRVIIDAQVGHVVKIYFDTFGDESLFDLVPPLVMEPTVAQFMLNEKGERIEVTTA